MGNELFTEVTDLTGLPKSLISQELVSILGKVGANPHAVTLEELRKAMATYLTEVIGPSLMDEENMASEEEFASEAMTDITQVPGLQGLPGSQPGLSSGLSDDESSRE